MVDYVVTARKATSVASSTSDPTSLLGRKRTSDSGYFSVASENGFRVVSTLTMAAMAAEAEPPPGADERDPRL